MSQSRNYGIDCIKGICILLVVLWHADMFVVLPAVVKAVFDAVLLNAFFVISGFLYYGKDDKNLKSGLLKKFKSLAIPYICFSILAIVWHGILVFGFDCREISDSYYGMSLIARDVFCMASGLGIGTMWFLPVLFVSWLGMVCLVKVLKKHKWMLVLVSLVLFVVCNLIGFHFRDLEFPGVDLKTKILSEYSYMAHRILYGLAYTLLGYVLRQFYQFVIAGKKYVGLVVEIILLLLAATLYFLDFVFPFEAVVCVFFVLGILLAGQRQSPKILAPITYMGRHSLEVMIYHYLFLLPVEAMLLKQFWPCYLQLPFVGQGVILFIVNVLTTALMVWLLGKSRLVMKLFGKKL